jgi:hypothetical protein
MNFNFQSYTKYYKNNIYSEDIFSMDDITQNVEYDFSSYCLSNEERILRKKIDETLNYCEFVIQKDHFQEKMDLDDIDIKYHIEFLIDKLCFYLFILEKYIEIELEKEYKAYQFILNEISLNNMIDIYIKNDAHFKDLRQMLIELYNIIKMIENK